MSQVRVLVDQVGYETQAPKQAIISGSEKDHPAAFRLIDIDSGKSVFEGKLSSEGKVYNWENLVFWTADFSAWQKPGRYAIEADSANMARSYIFEV